MAGVHLSGVSRGILPLRWTQINGPICSIDTYCSYSKQSGVLRGRYNRQRNDAQLNLDPLRLETLQIEECKGGSGAD